MVNRFMCMKLPQTRNKKINLKRMETLKSIANRIYEVCFDADRNIAGYSENDSAIWARANSMRHAHTIRAVLDYAKKTNKKNLKILNASGPGCGHQDFSIVSFFRNNTKIEIEWVAFESPNSWFHTTSAFKKYQKDLGIQLELSDFSKTATPYGEGEEIYDIVLFTEIAQQIDHSTLLTALKEIQKKIREDGILIVTTANLVELKNRIRILLGDGDGPYWSDTPKTTKHRGGMYGHIVSYDMNRLKRLMRDMGFSITGAYTFSYGHGPGERVFVRRLVNGILDCITIFIRNSRTTLFIVATKIRTQSNDQ